MKGVVTRVIKSRGFAFVRGDDEISYFLHASELQPPAFDLLREGQAVEFTPGENGKGPRAFKATVLVPEEALNGR
jgi:cold shock CspA family protein